MISTLNAMDAQVPPLSYAASGTSAPTRSSTLPPEVIACLKSARFLHLATCNNNFPHVSLMNYTYLSSSAFTPYPSIIMTTNPSSKKTENMVQNPRVSLLVHDWISQRPPASASDSLPGDRDRDTSPAPPAARSSLAALLLNLNSSALSSISATINGTARLIERGTAEEAAFKEVHLRNNTFGESAASQAQTEEAGAQEGDGGRGCFIEGEEVRVVEVRIHSGRIADWKGTVRDWELVGAEGESNEINEHLVNGVR